MTIATSRATTPAATTIVVCSIEHQTGLACRAGCGTGAGGSRHDAAWQRAFDAPSAALTNPQSGSHGAVLALIAPATAPLLRRIEQLERQVAGR